METKLHEIESKHHDRAGEVLSGVAIPPVHSGSRIAELYQAFTDFSAGAVGKEPPCMEKNEEFDHLIPGKFCFWREIFTILREM